MEYNLSLQYSILLYITDKYTSTFSEDSFVCLTKNTLFTNTDDSMSINQNSIELNGNYFSSPENCRSTNNNNSTKTRVTYYQSSSTSIYSWDSSSEKYTSEV